MKKFGTTLLGVFTTSLVISAILVFAVSVNLDAATITVTNGNDSGDGSLRQAIADANSDDVIQFLGVGTVTLISGQLEVTKPLTIDGGSGVTITRDTTVARFRIFKLNAFVTISNLTISNGYAAGGSGGGILASDPIDGGGVLRLKNCTISYNTAEGSGGGIYGELFIESSTISYNTAGGNGGGLSGRDGGITNSTISHNTAGGSGGGISGMYLSIENSIISHNIAENGDGGGIAGPDFSIRSCIIRNNTAKKRNDDSGGNGGGIYLSPEGWITNCLINNNYAEGDGGGIYFFAYDGASLTNSTVSNNMASGQGGGIYGYHSYPLTIVNSILWGDSPTEIAFLAADSLSNPVVTYSDIRGGYEGESNIDADPLFEIEATREVEPANIDYHLSENSPCIGSATLLSEVSTDIEGNPRPNPPGSKPDMGAYENKSSRCIATVNTLVSGRTILDGRQTLSPYTTGAMMDGMLVIADFSDGIPEALLWNGIGSSQYTGGVRGTGWFLFEAGDTFGGRWVLGRDNSDQDRALTRIWIDALFMGSVVFDTGFGGRTGTDGSHLGWTFDVQSAPSNLEIEVNYSDMVALSDPRHPEGDIYRYLEINFTNPGGFAAGDILIFIADTDLIIPEPSTILLLGIGLIGLTALGRKKLSKR